MNFLTGDVKKLYFKYLSASITSALVVSVYAFVDTIAVGQSAGPMGTAAMAVITPLYGLFAFFSMLCGIGGAVQLSRAKGEGSEEKGNAYFTGSVVLMAVVVAVVWLILALFHKPIFRVLGADAALMPHVMSYAKWMLICFPAFLLPSFIGALIRNDGAPGLAMAAVIVGGCVNIFGDWFFVFPMGMGMEGAAIATVSGMLVQLCVMSTHFFGKRCHLKLAKPWDWMRCIQNILKVGFASGIIELGTVFIAVLMNNQIMQYGSTTELAIYGVLVTILQLFAAMFSGVGQAIQPLVSSNYGAGKHERNRQFLRLSLLTVGLMGVLFTAIGERFPVEITRLFIKATPEVVQAAPTIFRIFFLLFIPLGFSVLAIYYLQSTMQHRLSLCIAVMRGIVVSGVLVVVLPFVFQLNGVWAAMPAAELLVAVFALWSMKKHPA